MGYRIGVTVIAALAAAIAFASSESQRDIGVRHAHRICTIVSAPFATPTPTITPSLAELLAFAHTSAVALGLAKQQCPQRVEPVLVGHLPYYFAGGDLIYCIPYPRNLEISKGEVCRGRVFECSQSCLNLSGSVCVSALARAKYDRYWF
jgi:hypothetical protein